MVLELFSWDDAVPAAADLGVVHFVGIGGVGMSAVARVMAGRGIRVSGSDAKDVPALAELRELGIDAAVGFNKDRLAAADTVVVGSAIRSDNLEVLEAQKLGKRLLHRSGALQAVMSGKRGIAVAGTNGKTTTGSMLAAALRHAGTEPGYAIGGELVDTGSNGEDGAGEVFVAEACESDGSFVVYRPQVSIVTNVQPDHLDYYGTADKVEEAFIDFATKLPTDGILIACEDDPGAARVAAGRRTAGLPCITYGTSPAADVRVSGFTQRPHEAVFTLTGEPELLGADAASTSDLDIVTRELLLRVPGEHNALNAAAAFLAGVCSGVSATAMAEGLAAFSGARRRFEFKGVEGSVTVYDDYAHNPPKVHAALATGRGLVDEGRLVVAFQPHLFSRTRDFAMEFGRALSAADVVVVTDIYPAREEPIAGVTGHLVADAIASDTEVHYVAELAEVAPTLKTLVRAGDVVLTVGAGDITSVGEPLLGLLGK